jgi:hypothetical protein
MASNKKTARIAGLIYLILVLLGIFNLIYVPSKLIFWDDAAATVNSIKDSEFLFKLGMVAGLFSYVTFLILPLALYKLLSQVDKTQAVLMVVLAIISVPISFVSIGYKFDVLTLLSGEEYLMVLEPAQLQMQVMLALESYNHGISISGIFWGLWLFPFGYLVYKSGFLPKVLGVFLVLGCFGQLINFLGFTLIPDYSEMGIADYVGIPSSIGEIGICLWLLIMGAKENPVDA